MYSYLCTTSLTAAYILVSCYPIITFIIFTLAAFGVDAAFSYKYNQQLGICDKDGLVISSGFNTSHVIPVWFTA